MTEQQLHTALELKGKAAEAEQQATYIRSLLEIAKDETAAPRQLNFMFSSKHLFTIPILKGLIEVFENQQERFDIEFQKL